VALMDMNDLLYFAGGVYRRSRENTKYASYFTRANFMP
jgi:hypothetical protein